MLWALGTSLSTLQGCAQGAPVAGHVLPAVCYSHTAIASTLCEGSMWQ